MPVSNERATYLHEAIRSVLNQTLQDWELIIVADGSDQSTIEVLGSYRDPRIRLVRHADSAGLAARLNEIAELAEGEYLARFDADDIMTVNRLDHQLAAIQESGADLISGRAIIIDEDTALLAQSVSVPNQVEVAAMLRATPFIHPTVFGRTDWFRTHRYDESLLRSQDKALWISAAAESTYFRDSAVVLFYRVGRGLDPSKYALTSRYERKVIRRYGPGEIGLLKTALLTFRSVLKVGLVRLSALSGRGNQIVRRRFNTLTDLDKSTWSDALRQSVSPVLPRAAFNEKEQPQ